MSGPGFAAITASLALLTACAATSDLSLFDVSATSVKGATALVISPAQGVRLSAALPPALETEQGVLRFQGIVDATDSLYFVAGATAPCPARGRIEGLMRASLCAKGERVCRTVAKRVTVRCD